MSFRSDLARLLTFRPVERPATKAAWRTTATNALAEVARLSQENLRMADQCTRYAAKLSALEWQHEMVLADFGNALDELRRLNGTLEVVSAVDRALPLGEGDAA